MSNSIYPCICFDNNAKEAADFYISVFPNAKVKEENKLVVMLEMSGQDLMLLNAGPHFKPNPSVSFMVLCSSESEVEELWSKLIEGGNSLMAMDVYPWSKKYGWVADQFGASWQLYFGEPNGSKEKFVPTLMFTGFNNGKAEEAMHFYTSVFPNSEIQGVSQYEANSGDTEGNVQHAQFDIDGYTLMCMDSSYDHGFNFTEGISLVKSCKNQEEIDYYWNKLTEKGGQESMCGWLKDQYSFNWQIVPENISKLLSNPETSPKVMEKVMKMKKLNIEEMEAAAKGH